MSPFIVAVTVIWPLVSYCAVALTMSCDGAPALSDTGSVPLPWRISADAIAGTDSRATAVQLAASTRRMERVNGLPQEVMVGPPRRPAFPPAAAGRKRNPACSRATLIAQRTTP